MYPPDVGIHSNLQRRNSPGGRGGVLWKFLGGDVPLEPWNPWPIPELVQAEFCYPILELTPQIPPSIDTIEADLRKFKLADLTCLNIFEWQLLVSLV